MIDCSQYQAVIAEQTKLLGVLVLVVNAFGAYIIIRTRRNGHDERGRRGATDARSE